MSAASNRGLRLGQYLAGLESAQHGVTIAQRYEDTLSDEDCKLLRTAHDILAGLEQRGWASNAAAVKRTCWNQ